MKVECHNLSDYLETRSAPSELIPGKTQLLSSVFTCPSCGKEHKEPPHGKERSCRCGLHWRAFGATLKLWRENDNV